MDQFWYATADFFQALYPLFKTLGRFGAIFYGLAIAVLSFYWMWVLMKNPDEIRSNRVEDQPE